MIPELNETVSHDERKHSHEYAQTHAQGTFAFFAYLAESSLCSSAASVYLGVLINEKIAEISTRLIPSFFVYFFMPNFYLFLLMFD